MTPSAFTISITLCICFPDTLFALWVFARTARYLVIISLLYNSSMMRRVAVVGYAWTESDALLDGWRAVVDLFA